MPMEMVGSTVVLPIFSQQGRETSSVSSAMIMPGQGSHQAVSLSGSEAKPIRLPKDICITASAALYSTAQAAATFPWAQSAWNCVPGVLPGTGVVRTGDAEPIHRVARRLELGGEDLTGPDGGDGEGDQGGGHIQVR